MDDRFEGNTIGERVRHWREKRGMTVPELASKVGSKPSTIYGLEIGDQKKTTALHKLAKVLRVNVEYLELGKGRAESGQPIEDEATSGAGWPFDPSLKFRFDRLQNRDKQAIEKLVLTYISHCEVTRDKRVTKRRTA